MKIDKDTCNEIMLAAYKSALNQNESGAKYWLSQLDDKQLGWLTHACKKLIVLAENELHVERPVRDD